MSVVAEQFHWDECNLDLPLQAHVSSILWTKCAKQHKNWREKGKAERWKAPLAAGTHEGVHRVASPWDRQAGDGSEGPQRGCGNIKTLLPGVAFPWGEGEGDSHSTAYFFTVLLRIFFLGRYVTQLCTTLMSQSMGSWQKTKQNRNLTNITNLIYWSL